LPESIFGTDVDKLFAYHTPKVVQIQDRSLGIVKMTLMVLIVVYVFIFSMLYKGQHFALSEVEGLARMQWQEPTMDWCNPSKVDCVANFSKLANLPYCKKYTGPEAYAPKVEQCQYYDARELPISLPNGILIPTYIQTYKQKKLCHEGDEDCKRKFQFVDTYGNPDPGQADGESDPVQSAFVADVEDFTVTIDHSFRTTDGKVSYDDFLMQGRWTMCDKEEVNKAAQDWMMDATKPPKPHECKTRPMKCVHAHCDEMAFAGEESWTDFLLGGTRKPDSNAASSFVQEEPKKRSARKTRGGAVSLSASGADGVDTETETGPTQLEKAAAAANKGGPQVVSMKTGDVLSLKTLLAMAGETLEDTWVDEDEGPQTLRSRGAAIVLHIHYDNAEHWKLFRVRDPPWYTVSVTTRPVSEFKHSYISAEDEYSRTLTWAYGIYVVVKQTGTIRTFNMVNALMTLTAAMALLTMSNLLTDFLALNIMPRKATYRELMYTVSDDMGGEDAESAEEPPENKPAQENMS
jgi:hypothetical protein